MILLLICFVSLLFVSFRMVSLPIDFVSHPKIPVSLRSETSETGGSVSLFREKKFRYVSLQFCFEAKFGDTLGKRGGGQAGRLLEYQGHQGRADLPPPH